MADKMAAEKHYIMAVTQPFINMETSFFHWIVKILHADHQIGEMNLDKGLQ